MKSPLALAAGLSDAHPRYQVVDPAHRWDGDAAGLWRALNDGIDLDTASDRWSRWFVLPSGNGVALRVMDGVREVRFSEPPLPGDGSRRNILHARWGRECQDLLEAWGITGWTWVDQHGEPAVVYVDRPRVVPMEVVPREAVAQAVLRAPAAPRVEQGDLLAGAV